MPDPYINRSTGVEEARGYYVVEDRCPLAAAYLEAIIEKPHKAHLLNISFLRDMYNKGKVLKSARERLQWTIEVLNRQANGKT